MTCNVSSGTLSLYSLTLKCPDLPQRPYMIMAFLSNNKWGTLGVVPLYDGNLITKACKHGTHCQGITQLYLPPRLSTRLLTPKGWKVELAFGATTVSKQSAQDRQSDGNGKWLSCLQEADPAANQPTKGIVVGTGGPVTPAQFGGVVLRITRQS